MGSRTFSAMLGKSGLAAALLLAASGAALAQTVNLTAAPASAKLSDGQSVPMWGYTCGAVASGATCARLNPNAGSGWSPVLITASAGSTLTINLTNGLSFAATGGGTNRVPTSLVIVGQLGGGLGSQRSTTLSPAHAALGTSWPGTSGPADDTSCAPGGQNVPAAPGSPPGQNVRVQSFATEVASGASANLTWPNLRPGTYLIESGTHPSIQGPMGLYGVLVVTTAPSGSTLGTAYGRATAANAVHYAAELALLLSEIDPVQNAAVKLAVSTGGFTETAVWNGQAGKCGDPSVHSCYPPAVNYEPLYYLINGSSFDRSATNGGNSLFSSSPAGGTTPVSGEVLLRFVNAGLRAHVPALVGAQATDSQAAVVSGMALIAEDGNVLPGARRIQSEVFLAAGKTYDVMINAPAAGAQAVPVFDRQLSLSTNNQRDGGMTGYISVNANAAPGGAQGAQAIADHYFLVAGNTLSVTDAGKGLVGNDIGIYGVQGVTGAGALTLNADGTYTTVSGGTLTLNANGTFKYVPAANTSDSFSYCGNGQTSGAACTTVTLAECTVAAGCKKASAPTANSDAFSARMASRMQGPPPGVLLNDTDPDGLPLTAAIDASCAAPGGASPLAPSQVQLSADGSFTATAASPGNYYFCYHAVNTQKTVSNTTSALISFPAGNGKTFKVSDAKTGLPITDYRWIIEEDRTFHVDLNAPVNNGTGTIPTLGTNFHTSHMPVVAQGCVGPISCEQGQTVLDASGNHVAAVCDVGNGACRTTGGDHQIEMSPSQVLLDPTKRYYVSILPGDGVNTTIGGSTGPMPVNPNNPDGPQRPFDIAKDCGTYPTGSADHPNAWLTGDPDSMCGHAMGGAQIGLNQSNVNVVLQQTPMPTAKISVFVFEDDNPLNGENDAGGGVDILAPNEPGLEAFNLVVLDQGGTMGDSTGQITYDMFNMPVSNSLANMIDPVTSKDACPINKKGDGLVGMIPVCPKYEADGTTLSPLAGQAVIANLYPGLYEIVATPGADRTARGEEWLQTSTLDGTKAIEAFIRAGEPSYFQEFGPGGFHVAVGFANPAVIKSRKGATADGKQLVCSNQPCSANVTGRVTNLHMSRVPDERVFSSGDYTANSFTQCYVSLGGPDGADFDFSKCDGEGKFSFSHVPVGNYRVTVFDQWNDLLVDGLSTPVVIGGPQCSGTAPNLNCDFEIPVTQWRTNLSTSTFIDVNGDGVRQDGEPGLPLVATNIRYRDGSIGFFNNTDLEGNAGFNEVFPFLNWLVVETDYTRYKTTGVHVVNDTGGPVDGGAGCDGTPASGCGTSAIAAHVANTFESPTAHVPDLLRTPGTRYCADGDCATPGSFDAANGKGSSGRVDPGWVPSEGWQGLLGQTSFLEFGKKPYEKGENGGVHGHVIYASTRPFDDPALLLQLSWEPGVPNVKVNLYKVGAAADGTDSLTLVDTTTTTSFDDWAQGFRRNPDGSLMSDGAGHYVPNMSCPGMETGANGNLFYYTVENSTQTLNPNVPLAASSRFKCFDGWSALNHIQPAPYDGMYKFPSVAAKNSATGESFLELDPKNYGTNCTVCTGKDSDGNPMLPPGKYVVEMVMPPGYELVKEEDKNILLGDVYVAPVTQQFAGLGNIYILPDQAAVNAYYNPANIQNATTNLGATPRHEGDTGTVETFWPCVGALRTVPDYNSLFPGASQAAPFAGANRPLCDRKEVVLEDQMAVLAKFYVFSSTHVAGHFTGTITNDFASEFDPFSPQFGEKFAVPNLPVSFRDFNGNEMGRVYSDQWGLYNGVNYSSYAVNPPNPTGYVPQMMIACMNDPGPIADPTGATDPATNKVRMITDPAYNSAYSNFCYEIPFMPGQTAYLDTPVIPTMAFADNYNLPDCNYPDATPAISRVDHDVTAVPATGNVNNTGPWVPSNGTHTLLITALGDQQVPNHAYSGPQSTTSPFNKRLITRHYGFGNTTGTVTIGVDSRNRPIPAQVVSWTDSAIRVNVPNGNSDGTNNTVANRLPLCTIQQRNQAQARCGELVITAANGKKSIDTITVTVGGKTPTLVTPTSPSTTRFGQNLPNPLQKAIDDASPGDLVIVGAGTYKELLLMWKPVRLQGVGAASVTINGDAHPAGKIDPWRRQVNCLFGLKLNGRPNDDGVFDPEGTYVSDCAPNMRHRVDRIPFEAIVGWDTSGNGNLAQLLQEPTLMGAYEGAGITVLGRGIRIPGNSRDFWGADNAGGFPDGSVYLTSSNNDCTVRTATGNQYGTDYGTSNYNCNPARLDGISVINSSQGGGAIFLHGWNHNTEVANTRISANHGTLTGGITVGNGEFPDPIVSGGDVAPPFPVPNGTPDGTQLGYGFNVGVNVHHNSVTSNASIGDALYSGTPSAAGGVTFCSGSDNYQFNYNWICGNLSTGDGGGVAHAGFSNNGTITHNAIIFNQSTNPTIPTHGGGLAILGASPDRTLPNGLECGNTAADADCPPGLPEGTGRNLLIDANLIMGNSAEGGSGGGLRLQSVNGQEVSAFPTSPNNWYSVSVTNNIIANNVAGWDGAGVSLQDALKVQFINNTVVANDTTASAGVLFNTLGATQASTPPPGCTPQPDTTLPQDPSCINPVTTSTPQAAGLVTMPNTPNLAAALPGTVVCPSGYGYPGNTNQQRTNGPCRQVSLPLITNDMFWQNRAFHIEVGGFGAGSQGQQRLVSLEPLLNQTFTGACAKTGVDHLGNPSSVGYWDIGVRGDNGPGNHGSGFSLTTSNSILTGSTDPAVIREYCNGSRLPPENGGHGYSAPPGHSEATGLYPVFSLNNITPAATVDEGNNWINLGYGPLALVSPVDNSTVLGNYAIAAGSPAINAGSNTGAPDHDFFANTRPRTNANPADIGAVEFTLANGAAASISPVAVDFGTISLNTTSAPQTLILHNNGTTNLTGVNVVVAGAGFTRPAGGPGGSCGTTLASGAICNINVVFSAAATNTYTGTVTVTTTQTVVAGSPVSLTGTAAPPPIMAVTGGPLAFGSQKIGTTSAAKTLTLKNTGGSAFTGLTVTFPANSPYSRPAGAAGGTCATSLVQGDGTTTGVCTINVVFRPRAVGAGNSTVTITGNAAVTGSPVTLTGTGTAPTLPTLSVLDAFTRGNSNNLGGNWSQAQLFGGSIIRVNANQATAINMFNLPGYAIWSPTGDFTSSQSAAFTFVNNGGSPATPVSGASLVLKGSGPAVAQVPQSFIRVRYARTGGAAADQVVVEYTTDNGMNFTAATNGAITANGKFATNDTLTATVSADGAVSVFRGATYLGTATLPSDPHWTSGGGSIGLQLPGGGTAPRVDNFAGGATP